MQPETPAVRELISTEKNYQSAEVWTKVTGKAIYGIDLRLPGMLYGKILRSSHPHARIKKIKTSAALKMPGVRTVLTGSDLSCSPYGIVINDEMPLEPEHVRYVGDEVAAVAAVDDKKAEEALKLIHVEYETLPAVFDTGEAQLPEAPQLHENFPGNVAWRREVVRGDPESAFRNADLVVEGKFHIPQFHPAYLEPVACVAVSEPDGGITLHTAVQSPDIVRDLLAQVLKLPLSRVRIVGPVMGGGFGGKVYGNLNLYLISAFLSMQTGLPVKMQLTREEEFTAGRPMVAAEIKMRMALGNDGTFLGREMDLITDNGAYSAQAPWVSNTLAERNDSVYRIPAIKTKARLVYTNKVPTGQYRAYGNQVANFACESLIDMAAKKLKIDPLEMRLRNCVRPGETTVHGLQIKSCGLAECLAAATEEIGWTKRKKGHGYGLSAAIHASGSVVFDPNLRGASARISLELDGNISLFTGEQDYGQGTHAAFSQIAAIALDLEPSRISVYSKDSLVTPYSMGALGMRQATIGGKAVQLAAEKLREKIIRTSSEMVGEPGIMENGRIRSASGRLVDFTEIAHYYHGQTSGLTLTGEGSYVPPESSYDDTKYGNIAVTYSFAAHAAEVEIDPETGALTVHRIVAAHDSGRIINHLSASGQIYGGVAQGFGMSCLEGYLFNEGRVANPTFADYKIPTALDVPDITPLFIETDDPEGPYGAKGLGEIVQVPVPGALANAVADAAGGWVTEMPITAEKIFRILSNRGAAK